MKIFPKLWFSKVSPFVLIIWLHPKNRNIIFNFDIPDEKKKISKYIKPLISDIWRPVEEPTSLMLVTERLMPGWRWRKRSLKHVLQKRLEIMKLWVLNHHYLWNLNNILVTLSYCSISTTDNFHHSPGKFQYIKNKTTNVMFLWPKHKK